MDSKRSANPPETLSTHEAERAISDQNTERQNRSHYALSGHRRGRPKQKNRCGRNAASAERVPADGRRSGQTRREFDAILPEKLQHDDIDGAGLRDAAGLQFDDIHAVALQLGSDHLLHGRHSPKHHAPASTNTSPFISSSRL